jgi:hypothetical protein
MRCEPRTSAGGPASNRRSDLEKPGREPSPITTDRISDGETGIFRSRHELFRSREPFRELDRSRRERRSRLSLNEAEAQELHVGRDPGMFGGLRGLEPSAVNPARILVAAHEGRKPV